MKGMQKIKRGTGRRFRSDIGKPVWHNSLRLPAGEHLSDEKWNEVAKDYMHGMGFQDEHQYVLVKHDSSEGEHVHIVACHADSDSGSEG